MRPLIGDIFWQYFQAIGGVKITDWLMPTIHLISANYAITYAMISLHQKQTILMVLFWCSFGVHDICYCELY